MPNKLNKFRDLLTATGRGFLGRASIVLSGAVLGQGLAFLMLPLITRVYSPESIGRASTTLAIFSMLMIVICLQYDQAVVVASREQLPYLLMLGCLIALGEVVLLALCLFILRITSPTLSHTLNAFGFNAYLLFLLLTYAPFLLLTQLHLRQNSLSRVSSGRFIYYGLGSILQVINGYLLGGTEVIFLYSQIAASLLATFYLLPLRSIYSWFSEEKRIRMVTFTEIKHVALTYINFPKYQAEAQFAAAVSINLPVIFMRFAFSEAWAGWYFLSWRILAAPATLISQAVGQVFYRDSAERERKGEEQGRILERVISSLIGISLFPALGFGIVVPALLNLLLGESWAPVATIIQILLIALVAMFFTSPISTLVNIRGLQSGAFYYYNLLLLTRLLALVAGWLFGSALGSIWLYSFASVSVLFLYTRYVVRVFGASLRAILRQVYPLLWETAIILAIAFVLGTWGWLYQPISLVLIFSAISICIWRESRRFVHVNFRGGI